MMQGQRDKRLCSLLLILVLVRVILKSEVKLAVITL